MPFDKYRADSSVRFFNIYIVISISMGRYIRRILQKSKTEPLHFGVHVSNLYLFRTVFWLSNSRRYDFQTERVTVTLPLPRIERNSEAVIFSILPSRVKFQLFVS